MPACQGVKSSEMRDTRPAGGKRAGIALPFYHEPPGENNCVNYRFQLYEQGKTKRSGR